jgi:hypothetical protein
MLTPVISVALEKHPMILPQQQAQSRQFSSQICGLEPIRKILYGKGLQA